MTQPWCLPCWRTEVSMTEDPPVVPDWPEEICARCGRRTNHGIYMDGGSWNQPSEAF